MKRLSIILGLLLTVGLMSAEAQRRQGGGQRPDPKEMANKTADTWQEEFGLSDEQRTKVYDWIIESGELRREKMQELRASGSFDREALREEFQEFQKERDEELKKILTDTQWTAYEQWKKDNPPRRRRGGPGGGGN